MQIEEGIDAQLQAEEVSRYKQQSATDQAAPLGTLSAPLLVVALPVGHSKYHEAWYTCSRLLQESACTLRHWQEVALLQRMTARSYAGRAAFAQVPV